MAYKIGFCPQCNEKLLIQDTNGQFNGFSPLHRQADLIFEDETRIRIPICGDCLKSPNFEALLESVLAEDSQACSEAMKTRIQAKGAVKGIVACEGVTKWQRNP